MLTFRDIDVEAEDEVQALVDWANDPSIRHLFRVAENQAAYERELELSSAQAKLRSSLSLGRRLHLIELDGELVGEVSVDLTGSVLHEAAPNTAWFGLVIGKPEARGRGLGRKAMLHIEALAKELGAKQAQLGVFEFNEPARKLYTSLGYTEVARIPNLTWWQGKTWTDIRMSKAL